MPLSREVRAPSLSQSRPQRGPFRAPPAIPRQNGLTTGVLPVNASDVPYGDSAPVYLPDPSQVRGPLPSPEHAHV